MDFMFEDEVDEVGSDVDLPDAGAIDEATIEAAVAEFGRLDGMPAGHARLWFRKAL